MPATRTLQIVMYDDKYLESYRSPFGMFHLFRDTEGVWGWLDSAAAIDIKWLDNPPPPPPPSYKQYKVINRNGLNIRDEPRADSADVGDLAYNQIIEIENDGQVLFGGYQWGRLRGTTDWVAMQRGTTWWVDEINSGEGEPMP